VLFGAYVDGMTADPSRLRRFARLVRSPVGVASYYYGYGDVFPGALERRFANRGRREVLISWHLDNAPYAEWAAGAFDGYLDQIAAAAREYPYDVYVRPWAEMNGDWQPFQPTRAGDKPTGGTYAEFKAAWRHVVTYLRRKGATNLKWVFNPAADVYAETTNVRAIWPGARYVDVLGIDGFNWGQDSSWGRWQSYGEIFRPMYRRLIRLHRTAPVWICEFGSKEPRRNDGSPVDPTRSKGRWLRDALADRTFPRVRAMVYFHARKERDWRVHSSRAALRATRQALSRARFR
jgi:beta-mannanase